MPRPRRTVKLVCCCASRGATRHGPSIRMRASYTGSPFTPRVLSFFTCASVPVGDFPPATRIVPYCRSTAALTAYPGGDGVERRVGGQAQSVCFGAGDLDSRGFGVAEFNALLFYSVSRASVAARHLSLNRGRMGCRLGGVLVRRESSRETTAVPRRMRRALVPPAKTPTSSIRIFVFQPSPSLRSRGIHGMRPRPQRLSFC